MQDHSPRRTFVKVAAAAIATARFPILGANDRINMGVIGLGGRGTDHMKFYRASIPTAGSPPCAT